MGWGDAYQHNGTTSASYKPSDTPQTDNTYREVTDALLQALLVEQHLYCPSLTGPSAGHLKPRQKKPRAHQEPASTFSPYLR